MNKLIKELKKKRTKAQHRLFELYSDYLYRVCYRYMNNNIDAQEVLSKSFMKIFDHVANTTINDEIVFRAWMKKIAINECLMELRKRKVFFMELDLIENIEEAPITSDEKLLEEDLVNMILKLPAGYRTVFSLYVIEGYKHEEIATKLGITVNTSKSQLRKARLQLKEMIRKIEKQTYNTCIR